jgi:hypothetical protein
LRENMAEPNEELQNLKRRISARLLEEPGVSGVGVPGGKLTVYLEEDSPTLRQNIQSLVSSLVGAGVAVAFRVTGVFHSR